MRTLASMLLIAGLLVTATARASGPPLIPLQGVLTDQDGVPINATRSIRYSLHTAETGGTEVWYDTFNVDVIDGLFAVYLGSGTALPLTTFRDQGTLWLEAKVESDAPMARVHLGSTPFSGYAEYCGNVPPHTHPGSDITGTIPATALPAGVVRGPLACGVATDVARGVDASGALVCSAVAWTDIAGKPTLVATSQQCAGAGDKVYGIDAAGALLCGADQGVTGSGTAGNVAMFTAAGAIGDAPITVASGVVTLPSGASTLAGAGPGSGLNADLLDGHHETAFMRKPGNVITVGKGADADYATITAALNSISNPSSTNTYVIQVGPGTYAERVTMKPYVDLHGAGHNVTFITSPGAATQAAAAIVTAASYSQIRHVTIYGTSCASSTYCVGVYGNDAAIELEDVNISLGGASFNIGVWVAGTGFGTMSVRGGSVNLNGGATVNSGFFVETSSNGSYLYDTRVAAVATTRAEGLRMAGTGSVTIFNSILQGSGSTTGSTGVTQYSGLVAAYGSYLSGVGASGTRASAIVYGGTFQARSSNLYGDTYAIMAANSGTAAYVTNSSLGGGASLTQTGAVLVCGGVTDNGGVFHASTCP